MNTLPIVHQAGREAAHQPAFLVAIIAESAFVLVLIFGIHLRYQQHILVQMKFFSKVFEGEELWIFTRTLLENLWGFLESLLMFLFILTSTYVSLMNVQHPLMSVILTRDVSRTTFFLSNTMGPFLAESLNIFLFTVAVSLVLAAKGAGWTASLVYSALSFLAALATLHAFASLLSVATRNAFASALFTLIVYFVLSPLSEAETPGLAAPVKIAEALFPNSAAISAQTRVIALGGNLTWSPYLAAAAYVLVYNLLGLWIFHRRDLP
jgi:hypothetical protein